MRMRFESSSRLTAAILRRLAVFARRASASARPARSNPRNPLIYCVPMLRRNSCLTLAATLALLASCAQRQAGDTRLAAAESYFGDVTPPQDNVFRFNLGAEPETYDPSLAVGQPDGRVARLLF